MTSNVSNYRKLSLLYKLHLLFANMNYTQFQLTPKDQESIKDKGRYSFDVLQILF